jgi:hypothetical protein
VRGWTFLLGGLIIWAVHFFALYIVASVFLTTPLARMLTLLISLVCLVAGVLLLARVWRSDGSTAMNEWTRGVALLGAMISIVAVLWQALPALLV